MEKKRSGIKSQRNKELDQFSVTLNRKHFDAVLSLVQELKAAGAEDTTL